MAAGRANEEGTPRRRSVARFAPLDGKRVVIDDPATLKALYDPLRFEIVGLLSEPRSVKELAAHLDRKASGLYHHVKLLEERGLIRVAEERVVSRRLERLYVRSASEFETAEELGGVLAGVVTDSAIASAVDHLRRAFQPEGEGSSRRVRLVADINTALTAEEAEALSEAVRDFVDKRIAKPSPRRRSPSRAEGGLLPYRLLISMAPSEHEAEEVAPPS